MSNTGTYVYRNGTLVKVSDRVRGPLTFSDVTFKEPFVTADITGRPIEVKSARHKRDLMKAYGLREPVNSKEPATSNRNRPTGCSGQFVKDHFDKMGYDRCKVDYNKGQPIESVKDKVFRDALHNC